MRRVVPLCTLVAALACGPGAAAADDMGGWCAQAKKAPSLVTCSDAELRQQAVARNKLFEAARAKLSPEAYKALTDDQWRWIKSYTARCGVAMDDPPPAMPIPQSVIECYRRESRARSADLAARLSEPNPAVSPPPATAGRGPLPPATSTNPFDAWKKCLADSAVTLADQPESAETVANGVFGSCGNYQNFYTDAEVKTGLITWTDFEKIKAAAMQRVIADVMAARNFVKWIKCAASAVDALADQPEPAQAVVGAVFDSCSKEELAYQQSGGFSTLQMEKIKATMMAPKVLARVMAARNAREEVAKIAPAPRQARPQIGISTNGYSAPSLPLMRWPVNRSRRRPSQMRSLVPA